MVDATVPAARQDPVLRKYVLRRLRLPIGDSVLGVVVPDAREWLRNGAGHAPPGRAESPGWEPPYWQRVWPAAAALAQLVARVDWTGRRVLDLGCGLGVPGISAARRGAAVTFADREPDALAFASWNARAAGPDAAVEVQRVDWSREVVHGQFDVVLLADVTYRARHHGPLRSQLQACLAPGGLVLHAEPMRAEAEPFLAWLRETNATCEGVREVKAEGAALRVRLVAAAADSTALASFGALVEALQRWRRSPNG